MAVQTADLSEFLRAGGTSGFRVAVFGLPGAGKSTAARRLSSSAPSIFWIEGSRDLIERLEYSEAEPFDVRAKKGLEYFRRAAALDGADWAARRAIRAADGRRNVLITGLRGVDNVRMLKSVGFYCVFFECSFETAARRVAQRDHVRIDQAKRYLRAEDAAFDFSGMRAGCEFSISAESLSEIGVERELFNICLSAITKTEATVEGQVCQQCALPTALFSDATASVCGNCLNYARSRDPQAQARVLKEVMSDIGPGADKALLGFSGGKDSTASLHYLMRANVRFETFTVDMGYYPITMIERARHASHNIGVPHEIVDGRECINAEMQTSYELTAALFDELAGGEGRENLLATYLESRRHYSTKDTSPRAFPRVCILCRKAVIRAYYKVARAKSAKYIILGVNEWASLAETALGEGGGYSGVRALAPSEGPPVYVVHLPYLLGSSLTSNQALLNDIGWQLPFGEQLVETNSNSCLLAKASEFSFFRELGFHPDATRLSREITVGYLQRGAALRALSRISASPWSVRQTLEYAGIIQ